MFDLEGVTVDSGTDNDQQAVTAEPDFPANETSDLYLAFGDAKRCIAEVIKNTKGVSEPDINTYENDLDDLARLLGEFSDGHPQAKLWLVTSLAKSTLGSRQADMNSFGIGLDNDPDVPVPYESKPSKDVFYYADVFRTLPTIETEGLTGGEREEFESYDIDPDGIGFSPDEGPQLPVFGGTRWPVVASSDDDVQAAIDLLKEMPKEPTTEETASGSEEATVQEPSDTDEEYEAVVDDVDPILNPLDFTVNELRNEVSSIDSLDTIELAIEVEERTKNRGTALKRLEERRNALESKGKKSSTKGSSRYASGNTEGNNSDDEGSSPNTDGDLTKPEYVKMLMDEGKGAMEAAEIANSIFD